MMIFAFLEQLDIEKYVWFEAMHSCFLRVNNWARDFFTKLQFYSSKSWKKGELWRPAKSSLNLWWKALIRKTVQDQLNFLSSFVNFMRKSCCHMKIWAIFLWLFHLEICCAKIYWNNGICLNMTKHTFCNRQNKIVFW